MNPMLPSLEIELPVVDKRFPQGASRREDIQFREWA